MRHVVIVLLASLLAACGSAPEDIDGVLENRTAVILAGIESGDMREVLALYTDDALYSPSGDSLLADRAALRTYWSSVLESPARDAVLEVVRVDWLAPDAFVEIQRTRSSTPTASVCSVVTHPCCGERSTGAG